MSQEDSTGVGNAGHRRDDVGVGTCDAYGDAVHRQRGRRRRQRLLPVKAEFHG